MKNSANKWWGSFELKEKQARYWEIGPLLLGIERRAHEWNIASHSSNESDKTNLKIASEECSAFPPEHLQFRRFIFHQSTTAITLTPILADRPQVSRAEIPFYLPANESVTIYVSSPAWVRLEAGSLNVFLDEIPSMRLSDTWYGPNTREGELCYSNLTFCRTHLTDLPVRPHRVLTPVIIHNHAKTPLLLERLSLPLPYLSIYADSSGGLWTEEIVVRNEAHDKHIVKQSKGAPGIAPNASLVSQPRSALKPHNLMTLFYSLLTE